MDQQYRIPGTATNRPEARNILDRIYNKKSIMIAEEDGDLDSWREVHRTLIEAVKVAEEAVASQKAQRRYWLEELCANLDDEGMHQPTSVWKRPATVKKLNTKRTTAKSSATKRKPV